MITSRTRILVAAILGLAACKRTEKAPDPTAATPAAPTAPGAPAAPTTGGPGCAIEGNWLNDATGIGQSKITIAKQADGTYKATEKGLGGFTGTAKSEGKVLQVDFNAGVEGTYRWTLDADCKAGKGKLTFKGQSGAHDASIQRLPAPPAPPAGAKPACAIEGKWLNEAVGIGQSTITIAKQPDGSYTAIENGMGSFTGTATGDGKNLWVEFRAGGIEGVYLWPLGDDCNAGKGKLTFTSGRYDTVDTTVRRAP